MQGVATTTWGCSRDQAGGGVGAGSGRSDRNLDQGTRINGAAEKPELETATWYGPGVRRSHGEGWVSREVRPHRGQPGTVGRDGEALEGVGKVRLGVIVTAVHAHVLGPGPRGRCTGWKVNGRA